MEEAVAGRGVGGGGGIGEEFEREGGDSERIRDRVVDEEDSAGGTFAEGFQDSEVGGVGSAHRQPWRSWHCGRWRMK